MAEAGRAVAREILERFDTCPVVVVCGKGNNAGDGFITARTLAEFGYPVTVVLLGSPEDLRGSAARAFDSILGVGVPLAGPKDLPLHLDGAHVVVDAVLGIGMRGQATGVVAEAIDAINECSAPVVAVDVPSGLREMEPGEETGPVVRASLTVTFGLPKLCLLTVPGWLFAGEVVVAPINFPAELLEDDAIPLNMADTPDLRAWLPARAADANKGDFGRVGIVAGSAECAGAAILCARAALRSGAGLVTIFTPPALNALYKAALPEATTAIVPSTSADWLTEAGAEEILRRAERMDVLAVGPGMGTAPTQAGLLAEIVRGFDGPLVLDADALTLLAGPDCGMDLVRGRDDVVLTPHPGEMARLTGLTTARVQQDRIGVARDFAMSHGVTLLLKGAATLVVRPDGGVFVNPGATSALAKAGTGDVLTGLVAALVAQGAQPWQAAVTGAQIHLSAGMSIAGRIGERGLLATDLADELPATMLAVEREEPRHAEEPEPPEEFHQEDEQPWV